MREIKFRGTSAHELASGNRWLYGNVYIGEYSYIEEMPVDEKTVGQYTGLEDKNGKEIYEGDILNLYIPNWSECDTIQRFVINDFFSDVNYLQAIVEHCKECWLDGESDYIEIIGNIHENPELLEDGK